jgi:GNAT superfamily N-acetyltransferase
MSTEALQGNRMQAPTVTKISTRQRDLALSVLTVAFAADPVMRWVFPNAHNCLSAFPEFANAFGGEAIEQGTAFVADGFKGAALWLPPGVESDAEGMGNLIAEYADESALIDAEGFMEQMAHFHPDDANCWYLPIIGVDCAHQGQGIGAALMKHALQLIDGVGGSAYLESSNPRNVSLYQRHGFEAMGVIQHGSSPAMTPMFRPAR